MQYENGEWQESFCGGMNYVALGCQTGIANRRGWLLRRSALRRRDVRMGKSRKSSEEQEQGVATKVLRKAAEVQELNRRLEASG